MANALDAVLQLRANEQARQQNEAQAISHAVDLFTQARQNAQANQLAQLQFAQNKKYQDAQLVNQAIDNSRQQKMLEETTKNNAATIEQNKRNFSLNMLKQNIENRNNKQRNIIDLAEKGLRMNPDGTIIRDESLLSESDKLIQKGKLADAARNLGDRNLFNSIAGINNPEQNIPQDSAPVNQVNNQTNDLSPYLNEIDPFTQKPTARAELAKSQQQEKQQVDTAVKKSEQELNRKQSVLLRTGKRIIDEWEKTNPSEIRTAQLASIPASLLQFTPDQKKDSTYRDFVKSLRAQLARGQGEVGNLAEGEQKAVMNAVPGLGDVRSVGYDKMVNYFKNIAETSTDEKTKSEALDLVNQLESRKAKEINPKDTLEGVNRLLSLAEKSVSDATLFPIGGMEGYFKKTENIFPQSEGQKNRIEQLINLQPKNDIEYLLSLGSGFKAAGSLFGNINNAGKAFKQGLSGTTAGVGESASQAALTKVEGDKPINSIIKDARTKLTEKGGYIDQEHKIYAESLDKIKGTTYPVKNSGEILDNFVSKNTNSTTGKLYTPEMESVYNSLNKKLQSGGNITEEDIVNSIKKLKGKFGSGKVDSNKRMNLNAASDLSEGLSTENQSVLKAANSRYASFKKSENDINDLIGLYADKAKTDAIVQRLLNQDVGIEQSTVAKIIGEKTGLNLLNKINYYRGINQVKDSLWFTRQLDQLQSGTRKIIKSTLEKK